MCKEYKVLMIDDHPLIIDAYKRALNLIANTNKAFKFIVDDANNCDSAVSKISKATKKEAYDLIFLDIKLPPSKNGKYLSGQDIGVLIRKKLKDVKVIVSTAFNDGYMVSCILRNINPEALLIKTDLTLDILVNAVKMVVSDPPYYSKEVIKILRKQSANDFVIDNIDRKILHELSNGTKMNELPKVLPLSIAALERRKRILKDVFDVVGKGDRDLLQLAQEKGFI